MKQSIPFLLLALGLIGCGKSHRPLHQIEADKRDLPTLYLTVKSQQRVMAPASVGVHVHEATGEICYQPYECTNPDCPGRTPDGNQLFVHPDVLLSVTAAGEIVYGTPPEGVDYRQYIESQGGQLTPTCPTCLEQRNLASESDAERAKYQQWVKPYELPETIQRRAELEEEYQAAFDAVQRARAGE